MKRITLLSLLTLVPAALSASPALAEEPGVGATLINLAYSIDTFYFLMSGALVMWMAAGFAMLEAGLVRSKNTVEILTKNVALAGAIGHVQVRRFCRQFFGYQIHQTLLALPGNGRIQVDKATADG